MSGIDRDLGMGRPIGRRDFVNGAAVALGASLLPKWSWALALDAQAAQQAAEPTPAIRRGAPGCAAATPVRSRCRTSCATAVRSISRALPRTPAKPTTWWWSAAA